MGYPEIEHPVKGVIAYSPDHETAMPFDGEGYILNRKIITSKTNEGCVESRSRSEGHGLLYAH